MTAPPRAPGELAEIEAERHELARFIENQIVAQRLQGETMITLVARQETWKLVLASLRSATGDGGEAMRERAAKLAETPDAWAYQWEGQPTYFAIAGAIRDLPLSSPTKIEGADE